MQTRRKVEQGRTKHLVTKMTNTKPKYFAPTNVGALPQGVIGSCEESASHDDARICLQIFPRRLARSRSSFLTLPCLGPKRVDVNPFPRKALRKKLGHKVLANSAAILFFAARTIN